MRILGRLVLVFGMRILLLEVRFTTKSICSVQFDTFSCFQISNYACRYLHLELIESGFPYYKQLHGFWRTLPSYNPHTVSSEPGKDLVGRANSLFFGSFNDNDHGNTGAGVSAGGVADNVAASDNGLSDYSCEHDRHNNVDFKVCFSLLTKAKAHQILV